MNFHASIKKDLKNCLNQASASMAGSPMKQCVEEQTNEEDSANSKAKLAGYNEEAVFRQESTKATDPPFERIKFRCAALVSDEEELQLQEYFNQGQGINLYEEEIRPLEELELLREMEEENESNVRSRRFYGKDSASSRHSSQRNFEKKYVASTEFRTPSPKLSRRKSIEQKFVRQFQENQVRVSGISNVSSEEVSDWEEGSCEAENQVFNK